MLCSHPVHTSCGYQSAFCCMSAGNFPRVQNGRSVSMNNLRLFDFVVIIKHYSIRILNLYITGHAGSISNASNVFLTEVIYSEFWPRHSGCFNWMLGAFAKLRRATVSFVMSVRLSVCPHGTTRLPLDGLSWKSRFMNFSKFCRENSSFNKMW